MVEFLALFLFYRFISWLMPRRSDAKNVKISDERTQFGGHGSANYC
jgi:hypothetical protein